MWIRQSQRLYQSVPIVSTELLTSIGRKQNEENEEKVWISTEKDDSNPLKG
jgi:hypothetical protein